MWQTEEGDMAPTSPTVARWELSLRLRQIRQDRDLSTNDIASALGFTRNYWSLVENDRTLIAVDKLVALAELFDLPADELQLLLDLRESGRERGWWMDYDLVFPEEMGRFYGMEYGATHLRSYEGQIVNGLLQTEQYAEYLMNTDPLTMNSRTAELLRVRKRRQARLVGVDPLVATIVLSEKALLQQVGDRQTMLNQLNHLKDLSLNSDSLEIRVVPFSHPKGSATPAPTFYLLDFEQEILPTISWVEAAIPVSLSAERQRVYELELLFVDAYAASLGKKESIDLIDRCYDIVRSR